VYSDNHGDIKMVKDVWKWINGARLVEKLAAPLDQKVGPMKGETNLN